MKNPRQFKRLRLLLTVVAGLMLPSGYPASTLANELLTTDEFLYDARMSFIKAGELFLQLNRAGTEYEVAGQFQTSRSMSSYYSWNGIFAAIGTWHTSGPVTRAYMSRTISKDDDLKIVLNYADQARLLDGPHENFEDIDKPGGIDLISALFFNPGCYEGGQVNDGEDTYQLDLRKQRNHELSAGEDYYDGPVLSCDYSVTDHRGRKRRVIVSLANIAGTMVAVQVRAKIPILPDAVFRLRIAKPPIEAQVAQAN